MYIIHRSPFPCIFTDGKIEKQKSFVSCQMFQHLLREMRTFQRIEVNYVNMYVSFPYNFSLPWEKQSLNNFGPADCKTCFWLHNLRITSQHSSGKEESTRRANLAPDSFHITSALRCRSL